MQPYARQTKPKRNNGLRFILLGIVFVLGVLVGRSSLWLDKQAARIPGNSIQNEANSDLQQPAEQNKGFLQPTQTAAEQKVRDFAEQNGLSIQDYPQELIELLERNPETEDFVLSYPLEHDLPHDVNLWEYAQSDSVPLFMQWDKRWGYLDYSGELAGLSACGPVCLSMVICYLTGDYSCSPDVLINYAISNGYCAPGFGSYWTLISAGGRAFGLDVTEFAPDKERILANLEVGNPIICIMGPGEFTTSGHFIVLTGIENGKITVNDPNSYTNSNQLWEYDSFGDQINNVWVLRNLD